MDGTVGIALSAMKRCMVERKVVRHLKHVVSSVLLLIAFIGCAGVFMADEMTEIVGMKAGIGLIALVLAILWVGKRSVDE